MGRRPALRGSSPPSHAACAWGWQMQGKRSTLDCGSLAHQHPLQQDMHLPKRTGTRAPVVLSTKNPPWMAASSLSRTGIRSWSQVRGAEESVVMRDTVYRGPPSGPGSEGNVRFR